MNNLTEGDIMKSILYLGIDVSKDKLDMAITLDGNKILASSSRVNSNAGFKKLLKWAREFKGNKIHVCLESTNIYHEEVANFLQQQADFIVSVVNPAQTKFFAKSLLLRCKTDKTDAIMLAKYAAFHKPKETIPLTPEIKEFRSLTRHLNSLVVDMTREKNRIKTVKNECLRKLIQEKMNFIDLHINKVHSLIEIFLEKHSTIKREVALLDSIEGIGQKTASILFSEMLNYEEVSTKGQIAHSGLDPSKKESGYSVKGKTKISNTGNARLRRALYMSALCCISKNGYFRKYYDRLLAKGKPKKVALTAVMRKMLATASGVLKSGKPFNPNWVSENYEEKLVSQ